MNLLLMKGREKKKRARRLWMYLLWSANNREDATLRNAVTQAKLRGLYSSSTYDGDILATLARRFKKLDAERAEDHRICPECGHRSHNMDSFEDGYCLGCASKYGKLRADLIAAAGEVMVSLPAPGTDMARLLSANVLLRQRLSDAREQVAGLERLLEG